MGVENKLHLGGSSKFLTWISKNGFFWLEKASEADISLKKFRDKFIRGKSAILDDSHSCSSDTQNWMKSDDDDDDDCRRKLYT